MKIVDTLGISASMKKPSAYVSANHIDELKSKGVEEAAREFLKEYHRNKKKSDLVLRDFPR